MVFICRTAMLKNIFPCCCSTTEILNFSPRLIAACVSLQTNVSLPIKKSISQTYSHTNIFQFLKQHTLYSLAETVNNGRRYKNHDHYSVLSSSLIILNFYYPFQYSRRLPASNIQSCYLLCIYMCSFICSPHKWSVGEGKGIINEQIILRALLWVKL